MPKKPRTNCAEPSRASSRPRPHGRAVGEPDPARPDGAVHRRRHGAVQAVLRRRRGAAVQAGDVGAEVRPGGRQAQRPRRRRPHQPPPRVLRDARQLQLRRLLQGAERSRARGSSTPRCSGSTPTGSGSPSTAPTTRPSEIWHDTVGVPLERIQRLATRTTSGRWATPARAGRAPRSSATWARRSARAVAGARRRRALSSRSGTSCSCSTTSSRRRRWAAAEAVHRHRRRARAQPRRAAGRRLGVGDRRDAAAHRGGASGSPARATARRRTATVACGSWPSTPARSRSSSTTACSPRTRAAATCCGGSSGARCATPTCSAASSS